MRAGGGAVIQDVLVAQPSGIQVPCAPFSFCRNILVQEEQLSGIDVLKISIGASASLGFRVKCSFHNQLLCDVTTRREVQAERDPELGGARQF